MRHLPLYPDRRAVIERVTPVRDLDKECTRCRMSKGVRTVCMGADASREADPTGGVLVIVDHPTAVEDHSARAVSAGANLELRALVESKTDKVIVYAHAIRCAPAGRGVTERTIEACAGYTAGLIAEMKPSRILCFGEDAYATVLGVDTSPIKLGRKNYGYLSDETPVFMLSPPRMVTGNRFLGAAWVKDVEWALTATPDLPPWGAVFHIIEDAADAELACKPLAAAGAFTYDIESGGRIGTTYFQVVCLAAVAKGDRNTVWVWPEEGIKDPACTAPLTRILCDASIGKIGHNLKFDIQAAAHGLNMVDATGNLPVTGAYADTMLWMRMFDTEASAGLAAAANRVGMGGHKSEMASALKSAIEKIKVARADPKQRRLHEHPALAAAVRYPEEEPEGFAYALTARETLYRYCALDTLATSLLYDKFAAEVASQPHYSIVHHELHLGPTEAVAQIEAWGMRADKDCARLFGNMLRPKHADYTQQIRALGCDVDLDSDDQLREYVFGTLKMPVIKLTATGKPSVAAGVLKALEDRHPVMGLLMKRSKVSKLLSTYVDGLIPHIRDDSRIRTSINIAGTRTGRTSSSNPNLQNIPSAGEYAKIAKSIFNAAPGNVLLQIDYSQLEVRVAAILSRDAKLAQAYIDGVDVHRRTASLAYSIPEHEVTKEQRRRAKAVVFGLLFGKSVGNLATELGVSESDAREIYNLVLGAYPDLSCWLTGQKSFVERHGYVWTYVAQTDGTLAKARRRLLWGIASHDGGVVSKARNGSMNTPIQGSASDYMMRALTNAVRWIKSDGVPARIVNMVHDSLIIETPGEWATDVAYEIKRIMEALPTLGVPLVADVDIGLTWGNLHKLKGVELYAQALRAGMCEADALHVAAGDSDVSEEINADPASWTAEVSQLTSLMQL